MDIAEIIISWRKKLGYSQNALAKKAGIAQTALSDIETRKHSPTIATLEKICAALDVSLLVFLSEQFKTHEAKPILANGSLNDPIIEKIQKLPPSKRKLAETFIDYLEQLNTDDEPLK